MLFQSVVIAFSSVVSDSLVVVVVQSIGSIHVHEGLYLISSDAFLIHINAHPSESCYVIVYTKRSMIYFVSKLESLFMVDICSKR